MTEGYDTLPPYAVWGSRCVVYRPCVSILCMVLCAYVFLVTRLVLLFVFFRSRCHFAFRDGVSKEWSWNSMETVAAYRCFFICYYNGSFAYVLHINGYFPFKFTSSFLRIEHQNIAFTFLVVRSRGRQRRGPTYTNWGLLLLLLLLLLSPITIRHRSHI